MTAKRVLISIDEHLLDRIDRAVARRGLTRSGYLAQLASADLEAERGSGSHDGPRSSLGAIPDLARE
jgi:metal-responsive CopG/Arc/MetJ family transcriptional regulator